MFQCYPDLAAPEVLARGDQPSGISAGASDLYWLDDGWLVAMPKQGGAVRRLTKVRPASRVVASGPWVYVANQLCDCLPGDPICGCIGDVQMLRVPSHGGRAAAILDVSCEFCKIPIALRGGALYLLAPDDGAQNTSWLTRVSVYGGKARRITEADGDSLVLVGSSAVVAVPAARVDLRTGTVTKIPDLFPPLVSDGREVFGICNEGLCALVPGKKVRVLGSLPVEVDAIALDARDVYIAESSEELERVRAFPRHGGAPATLQCGRGTIESMVADRGGLYLIHLQPDAGVVEHISRNQAASPRVH